MIPSAENKARFYRLKDIVGDRKAGVPGILPISKETWYMGIRAGRYPRPVKLSEKTSAWRVADIDALVDRLNKGKWAERCESTDVK